MNPSEQIDNQIAALNDWRGRVYGELRRLINETDPKLKEEWKWGTAVWSLGGNVCALGAFKDHLKINFFKGAHLVEQQGMFNSGLEAKESRSIDLHDGDSIDECSLKKLVQAAISYNIKKP